jgi:hypothetical protein
MFELDRFFLYPSGQLGVGFGIGWFKTTANAFELGADGKPALDENDNIARSEGDETTFRIVPLSVNAVYRFTNLDDEWRIPVIPYGKLGLSYYLWSVSQPNGDVAEVPSDPMCDPTISECDTNEARGGSLGWQATLGVSIRIERLDPKAASSLRGELGIEHAGLFAELLYAKVDGFGADDKLRVGDTTWLAGMNFEF